MGKLRTFTRRAVLIGSAAVTGGVVFGYWRYRQPYPNPLLRDLPDDAQALTPYVRIDQKGVTVIVPRAEMGQGVHTTLAALVAEELDLNLEDIRVEHGPASKAYYNAAAFEDALPYPPTDLSDGAERMRRLMHVPAKFLGMQITGGSSSIPDAYEKMRSAGAAARHALLAAAVQQTGSALVDLATSDGNVVTADGNRIPYPALAAAAATIDTPSTPALKPRSRWRLLGRSLPRVDMVAKCTGTAEYAIDVQLPGMRYATVRMNPQLGAPLASYDAAAAEAMPGVESVIALDGGVAVVASNTWYAMQAVKAIDIDWEDATYPRDTDGHFAAVAAAFDGTPDSQHRDDGDVDQHLGDAGDLQAEYRAPYLAHATMEPLNAVARFADNRLEVWAGNQAPTLVAQVGADICDIDRDDVDVHTTFMGGGFGRRAEMDFVESAIRVARAMPGKPIKMTWSREEDTSHDTYRPLAMARLRASIADGKPRAMQLDLAAPSVMESQFGRIGLSMPGPDMTIVQAGWDQPYDIPNYRVTGYRAPLMLPISSWRSVGASQNGFFHESAIDELAHAAGRDPLDMRLQLISDANSRKVLEAVAELSGWGSALPAGHARGIAFVLSFGVPTAEVIEVAATATGISIVGAYAAVDVGTALDPRNIEAQVQSGINFGLAAAIMGEVTVKDGAVEQQNFHHYDSLRISQAPPVRVRILENGAKIRGIGEPGTPPAAPALANAIFAATGQRIRELPLQKHIAFA